MGRKWILPASVVGIAFVAAVIVSRRASQKRESQAIEEPILFAHRGASAELPENTLAAFEAGIAAGATHLEMDVHATRDGHIAVIHDDSVERTTEVSRLVRDMTLAELQSLDAGHRFSSDGVSYPYRGRGLRVPTLGEVFRRFPEAGINLEIKDSQPGVEAAVLREIRAAGAEGRTLVAATKHGVMRRFRKLTGGKVATAASRREIRDFLILSRLRLEGLLRPAYVTLQVPPEHRGIRIITPRFIRAARNRDVRVDAWTINDPEEVRRLIGLRVGGIMSDSPAVVKQVLDSG